jgi:hypothetical protein
MEKDTGLTCVDTVALDDMIWRVEKLNTPENPNL